MTTTQDLIAQATRRIATSPDALISALIDAVIKAAPLPAVSPTCAAAANISQVAPSVAPTPPPTDDELWNKTLRERDRYHEVADMLAQAIAKHFDRNIGEHSSINCPWDRALKIMDEVAPTAGNASDGQELLSAARNLLHVARGMVDTYSLARMDAAIAKMDAAPFALDLHADDIAVDQFAAAMKVKMAAGRAKGRGGWEGRECTRERLSGMLVDHVAKGDPVDVGNFAMMLFNRGESTTAVAPDLAGDLDNFGAIRLRFFRDLDASDRAKFLKVLGALPQDHEDATMPHAWELKLLRRALASRPQVSAPGGKA